jgi:hypothetical protein
VSGTPATVETALDTVVIAINRRIGISSRLRRTRSSMTITGTSMMPMPGYTKAIIGTPALARAVAGTAHVHAAASVNGIRRSLTKAPRAKGLGTFPG